MFQPSLRPQPKLFLSFRFCRCVNTICDAVVFRFVICTPVTTHTHMTSSTLQACIYAFVSTELYRMQFIAFRLHNPIFRVPLSLACFHFAFSCQQTVKIGTCDEIRVHCDNLQTEKTNQIWQFTKRKTKVSLPNDAENVFWWINAVDSTQEISIERNKWKCLKNDIFTYFVSFKKKLCSAIKDVYSDLVRRLVQKCYYFDALVAKTFLNRFIAKIKKDTKKITVCRLFVRICATPVLIWVSFQTQKKHFHLASISKQIYSCEIVAFHFSD